MAGVLAILGKERSTMRPMHILAFSALLAVPFFSGCSSKQCSGFGNCEDNDGGPQLNDAGIPVDDAGNPIPQDSGCPFCGVDSSADGSSGGCNPNPANFDVPGNNCDDDGDGIVDNPQGTCDTGLPTSAPSAAQFAKAIGLCPNQGDTWGVTSATYTQGVGSTKAPMTQQYGTDATFGTNVKARQGNVLGILSSGVAAPEDCSENQGEFKGAICSSTGAGSPPPGYPKNAKINNVTCPGSTVANDVVDVVLKVQVPANAKGFSFDFNFYSGEWPEWVCTSFNDSFVAWLTSTAWKGNASDFNISLDPNNNPVSVNNQFFQACSPANATVGCAGSASLPKDTCTLGNGELQGTGFFISGDDSCGQTDSGGGATGWLTTQAPVTPGEVITIQFMVWNTGDEAYDSSVLLDNWQWVATDTTVTTGRPPN